MSPCSIISESTCRPNEPTDTTGPFRRCSFKEQTRFTAFQKVDQLRNATCSQKEEQSERSVWDIRAPDFAIKCYAPPIKKPPRVIARPIADGDTVVRSKKETDFKSSRHRFHFGDTSDAKNDKDFIVKFRISTPNRARRIAAVNGKHPQGQYRDPKPYDHRGLPPIKSLGLPELVTSFQPDPLNFRFKRDHLDILDLRQVTPERPQKFKTPWANRKTPEPKWTQSLTLHREPYRKRYAAFTRHRRLDRAVYSALMERIEEDFTNKLQSHRLRMQNCSITSNY